LPVFWRAALRRGRSPSRPLLRNGAQNDEPARPLEILWGAIEVYIQRVVFRFAEPFDEVTPMAPVQDVITEAPILHVAFELSSVSWILASGVVQLLSRLFSGTGSFENTVVVIGFGIGLASWTTGFHDLLTSFLGGIHIISQHNYEIALNSATIWRTLLWIQFGLYLICFLLLFTFGIKTAHKIKTGQALFLAITGFLCYQLFFLIFNR